MDVGLYVRDFIDDPSRPLFDQIEEAAEIFRRAKGMGFTALYMPQHFIAYPTIWPQPMQILSRLAPDTEGLRLMTGILLLTYHNPVDIAEQTATLDQISNGRFTLGVGLGYVEKELEAFGTNRAERVSRLEESIALMKEPEKRSTMMAVTGPFVAAAWESHPCRSRIPLSGWRRKAGEQCDARQP